MDKDPAMDETIEDQSRALSPNQDTIHVTSIGPCLALSSSAVLKSVHTLLSMVHIKDFRSKSMT
jgi:hypothetical protein